MEQEIHENNRGPFWFAIRTRHDRMIEKILQDKCDEVFFPKETVSVQGNRKIVRAVIPHVMFIRTTEDNARYLENLSRSRSEIPVPFWIYRYPQDDEIRVIPQRSINLLRLLTIGDTPQCRIYTGHEFKVKDHVRVTDGLYKGYEGYVQRIRKNKHVIVKIEGVCMVMLPFIHPDLLQPVVDKE